MNRQYAEQRRMRPRMSFMDIHKSSHVHLASTRRTNAARPSTGREESSDGALATPVDANSTNEELTSHLAMKSTLAAAALLTAVQRCRQRVAASRKQRKRKRQDEGGSVAEEKAPSIATPPPQLGDAVATCESYLEELEQEHRDSQQSHLSMAVRYAPEHPTSAAQIFPDMYVLRAILIGLENDFPRSASQQ